MKSILKITISGYLVILCFASISSMLGYSIQPHWILNLQDALLFIGNRQISSNELHLLFGIFCISLYLAIVHYLTANKNQSIDFVLKVLAVLVFSIFLFPDIITFTIVWPVILISWIIEGLKGGFITMFILAIIAVAAFSLIIKIFVKNIHVTER